jgi:hypothetical protein
LFNLFVVVMVYLGELLAQVPASGDVKTYVQLLLGPAAGVLQQVATPVVLRELKDGIQLGPINWTWEPSPRGKRWLAFWMAVVIPTFLYVVVGNLWFGWWGYDREDHAMYMLAAFGVSQFLHGFSLSRQVTVPPPDGYALTGAAVAPSSADLLATPHLAPASNMNPAPVALVDMDVAEGIPEGAVTLERLSKPRTPKKPKV